TGGADLQPREVLLSRELAHKLHAKPGDRLRVSVELPGQVPGSPGGAGLSVAGIARSEGAGAYGLRPSVFVPLPTIQRALGTDAINVVWLSANGGLESGVQGGDRALPAVRRALTTASSPVPLEARPVKRLDVNAAEART